MKFFDERTERTLEAAAKLLGDSEQARLTVRFIYSLGRLDAGLELLARRDAPRTVERTA